MKKIFILLLLAPFYAFSQKIALIDRNLSTPITFVNELSISQLEHGYFTMHRDNMQKIIDNIGIVRDIIKEGKEMPAEMKSLVLGDTYFTITGEQGNYGVVLDTKINRMGTYYILADKEKSKKKNLEAIDDFVTYLKNNM